jgi:putative ABC transport system permease protein
MRLLSLALRNLLRNRRRSLATVVAMVIGSVAILLFGGYIQNIEDGMQTDYVRGGGHLQLQHRDYFLYGSGDPTAYGIADYRHVIDVVRADPVLAPMLTVVTPTLEFDGIAGNFAAGVSKTIFASGVVVEDQNAMQLWNDYGFPGNGGKLALTGTGENAAIIGTGVARVLRLCAPLHVSNCPQPTAVPAATGPALPADVADLAAADREVAQSGGAHSESGDGQPADTGPHIELLAATTDGAPNVARLRVVKAESLGMKEADDAFIGLHLQAAQRLLYGRGTPEVNAIDLQLQHTSQIPLARARLEELLQTSLKEFPLAVYDFRVLNPYYDQTLGFFGAIFSFIAVLIGAIVLFTVGNTMNAAVVERTVEIGTLRAMGQRRAGIRRLFLGEALLLGLVGALTGVVAALLLAALINHSGLTWTPPGRVNPIHLHVRVWGEWRLVLGTALGLLWVAAMSAWWPAGRAARLQVVEALRHA